MTNPKYWRWIPWVLANLIPLTFVYYFITPWVKNSMGTFVDSLLKSANISQSTRNPILWSFIWIFIISAVGLLIYYYWQSSDFSIDKYGGQLLINYTVLVLLVLFFLVFILNGNAFWLTVQKIVISVLLWEMMTLTATYLTKENIRSSKLNANLIIIIPIIISIFALINSYYH